MLQRLGRIYVRVYDAVCGRHPRLRPWHAQWSAVRAIYADLRRVLAGVEGDVLDVGCGTKPYAVWLTKARRHTGVDIEPGPGVDLVITPGKRWPLDDGAFDAVLCTQVLEHAADFDNVLGEMRRVLRPGGQLIVTVPFLYNEHGAPHDYRRLSAHGARQLFARTYDVEEVKTQGALGSTLAVLGLNWLDSQMCRYRVTQVLRALLLPLWVFFCALANGAGVVVDLMDNNSFYMNVLLVAQAAVTPVGGP